MPTLDSRPGKLDVVLRNGNALALNLTFPAALTGRTFTADVDGTALSVSVDGAVITVTFSAVVTAALTGRPTWRLVETTAGTQTLITGRVLPSLAGTESQDLDVNVSVDTVAVTVVAGPAGGGSSGSLTVQDENLQVATAVTQIDFQGAGVTTTAGTGEVVVTIPGGGGTPASTVVAETAFGQASAVGAGTPYARNDHSHGTPANPVAAHEAAGDPHPSYLTAAEGAAAYEPTGTTATHAAAVDPHAGYRLESVAISAADVAADVATQGELDAEAAARTNADALLIPLTQKAAANGVATLGADSKIPSAQLPSLAITSISVVANQAAMLALAAQEGDVARRTDLGRSFMLTAGDPTVLASWVALSDADTGVATVDGDPGPNVVLAVDGAAGVGTKRTLGTGAQQAAAGDDARITGALQRTGGTLTGALVLAADGSAALHPVSKQQLDSATSAAAQKAADLSDLASAATARTNLGLGTAATTAATAYDAAGSASAAQTAAVQRANHTGTQAIATVSGLQAAIDAALIPVQDEGVTVTADPSAINFVGAGVTATNVGTVATVTIPGGAGGGSVATDTLFDAKGDMAVGTGSDTAARLATGPPGSILVPTPSKTTGLFWVPQAINYTRIVSGEYLYPFATNSAIGQNLGAVLGSAFLCPLELAERMTFDQITCQVLVAGAGTNLVLRLAVFADDGTGRRPVAGTAPTFDAGTVTADSAANKSIVISLTLDPGRWWTSMVLQGDTCTTQPQVTSHLGPALIPGTTFPSNANASPKRVTSTAATTGALTAGLGAFAVGGNANIPTILLRAA